MDTDLDTEFIDGGDVDLSFSSNYCIQDETVPWYGQVDFIIDGISSTAPTYSQTPHLYAHQFSGGPRPLDIHHMKAENGHGLSTVVDLTHAKPIILRQGMGEYNFDV